MDAGDIASSRHDDDFGAISRADDQGFGVDLDKVTAVLENFPGITRACATFIGGVLHGFYSTTTFVDEHDLDAFARQHLPHHSVPEKLNYLATIPVTANGEVNKLQLSRVALRPVRTTSSRRSSSFTTKDLYHPVSRDVHVLREPIKRERTDPLVISEELSEFNISIASIHEEPDRLPGKNGFRGQRWLRHRMLTVSRAFFSFIVIGNLAAAVVILYLRVKKDRYMLADIATATAANLTLAVVTRSELTINLLFAIFCSVPTSWPLAIRRHCARINQMGGIHSGAAIAATIWFTIFTIGGTMEMSKPPKIRCITVPSLILTYIILLIFIVLVSTSHPSIRNRYRTAWQLTHRYGLFIALVLFWIQTFFTTKTFQYTMAPSEAYIYSPPVWLLTGITVSLIFPWLFLRKVSVRPQALSDQAIRLHFEHTSPIVGTSVRISERPLVDWHRFATITNPIGKGFSLVIHNTNAFTKRTIERAPTSIWVRGIPTCSTLRISTLFKSIVLVAIGSGITPCLAVILAKKTPCRVLWTTESDPEQTYGKEIVDSVLEADPKAVIHNTRVQGKLDLALETWKMWKESKAEAVCVVGDKGVVGKLVYEMECRGIPAYGGVS